MSRTKGKVGERELARLAREGSPDVFPDARRGINQGRSGVDVPDIILDDTYWTEVKRRKGPQLLAALRQATLDSHGSGRVPIAVCRDDGCPIGWTVTMTWEHFVELVRAHKQLELVVARTSTAAAAELERDPFAGVPTLEDAIVPDVTEAAAE
jgi:hypothetical protein